MAEVREGRVESRLKKNGNVHLLCNLTYLPYTFQVGPSQQAELLAVVIGGTHKGEGSKDINS